MPQQQQKSTLAARLGGRLSAANAATKDLPPIEVQMRLPAGIRNGVAKLAAIYFKEQTEDGKKVPKGELFFRASAVTVYPEYHNGVKAKGAITQQVIALCDVPARGEFGKPETFQENYDEFRSLMAHLDVKPPPYDDKSDPDGTKTQAYWEAAFQALLNPQRPVLHRVQHARVHTTGIGREAETRGDGIRGLARPGYSGAGPAGVRRCEQARPGSGYPG